MRILPLLTAVILTAVAHPALACRVPQSQFVAAFLEEPESAPGAFVLHGRLAPYEGPYTSVGDGPADDGASEFDALYLFGVLERTDGPSVRVYRRGILSSCDITPRGIFENEVWIVGRPLADDDAGDRVALLVRRRSGVWGPE